MSEIKVQAVEMPKEGLGPIVAEERLKAASIEPPSNNIEQEVNKDSEKEIDVESDKEKSDFNSKFAALTRRDKELRERESQIDAKLQQLEQMMGSLQSSSESEPQEKEVELSFEQKLKRNPLEALAEKGFSYEKLTELALNDGQLTPDMQMQLMKEDLETNMMSKIEQLEAKLAEKEQREAEDKYNSQISNFKEEISDFIGESEKHPLVKSQDAQETVYNVILEHYNKTQRVLSIEEATDMVEQHLQSEFKKLYSNDAVKRLLEPEAKTSPEENISSDKEQPTLSNSQAARVSNEQEHVRESREQRLARIAKKFQNTLWKE